MKAKSKIVRITVEAAKKVGGGKNGSDLTYYNALLAASESDKTFGPCKVSVELGEYSESDPTETFILTGTEIEASAEDMANTAEILKRIRHDAADETVQLHDILNGDGLPLYYNGIFRETFIVKKGRVSREEVQKETILAATWAWTTNPKTAPELCANVPDLIAKWKAVTGK